MMRSRLRIAFGLFICVALSVGMDVARNAGAQTSSDKAPKMKVYISVDMEGVAGTVTIDQLGPNGFEYGRFRKFMTDGENLLIEDFPADVRIVRSWPRHGGMMAGLDTSFSAALFVGYHASTTNPKGVRAHTFSSAHYARVALNGVAVTEGEYNAAYAGAKGVPVIFVSGDDIATEEIKSRLGDIETVVTKKALGFHSAETLTPAASCDKIYAGAKAAFARLHDFKPYVIKTPVTLEITFKNYTPAELLSYLRSVQRVDSHTIRFVGKDMDEVDDFEEFVGNYGADLTP
ncbi:MAG: M55 family metallopeptidase [Candidatus Acidiferrum sp.]